MAVHSMQVTCKASEPVSQEEVKQSLLVRLEVDRPEVTPPAGLLLERDAQAGRRQLRVLLRTVVLQGLQVQ